ncbi:Protein TRAUCO [Zea mays]|uniref:Protein TRAUCO n=1 Tax=Zea mays TaxID=4577 RepID=A0A1D6NYR5_MAIZE|nr:Protein TRAUCO [Zea mays]
MGDGFAGFDPTESNLDCVGLGSQADHRQKKPEASFPDNSLDIFPNLRRESQITKFVDFKFLHQPDIMAIVVHLDTIHRTMWGPFRKIVIMDARGSLHIIKVWGDLLNKNALRRTLAKEDYGIIIETMFRRFRRQAPRKPWKQQQSNSRLSIPKHCTMELNCWVQGKLTLRGSNPRPNAGGEEEFLLVPATRLAAERSDDAPGQPVLLSRVFKSERIELSEDRLIAASTKGFRMVRATRGVVAGAWYFEVKVVHLGPTGHTRLGWATNKADLQMPVGFDAYGFGYRDVDGAKVTKAWRDKYADEGYGEGDVLGFYISLPDGERYEPKQPDLIQYKGMPFHVQVPKEEQKTPDPVPDLILNCESKKYPLLINRNRQFALPSSDQSKYRNVSDLCCNGGGGISINHMKEVDSHAPVKQKLQLFPINEATLKPFEKVDLLDSPIARLPDIETTTLGATYVASLDAGVWTKEQLFAEYAITNGVVNGSEAMSKESHENLTSKEPEDSGIKNMLRGDLDIPVQSSESTPYCPSHESFAISDHESVVPTIVEGDKETSGEQFDIQSRFYKPN